MERRTVVSLDGSFGPDRGRALVVRLVPGHGEVKDMVELRPSGTRRVERIAVHDLYRYAIRCRVGRELLEKARERKAKKAERLARERQARAERKLFER